MVLAFMFLFGLFPGLILLSIGLWRSRLVPRWSAALVGIFAVADFGAPAGKTAPILVMAILCVGLATIGVRVLRMSDSAWGLLGSDTSKDGRRVTESAPSSGGSAEAAPDVLVH